MISEDTESEINVKPIITGLVCELSSVIESLIGDVLPCGLNNTNQHIKEWLLLEEDPTLSKALAIFKAAEISQQHIQKCNRIIQLESAMTRKTKIKTNCL